VSGIAAAAWKASAVEQIEWVRNATAFMHFRGPDGGQVWHDERAALGHALLSFSADDRVAAQPSSLDGEVWITAAARIDGRSDLVRALALRGTDVRSTRPDAELLLHAYQRWGEDALSRLIGDFAFVLWDRRRRTLVCATDRFGVAPLFYSSIGETLIASNTLEALLLHARVDGTLNERAVADLLVFNMNMNPAETTFSAIHRLPAAHALRWTNGDLKVWRYWKWSESSNLLIYPGREQYTDRFRYLFTEAVSDRLRVGNVSVQLSGGLDSTSVAVTARRVLAARGSSRKLRAQLITIDGLMDDEEGSYARRVAESIAVPVDELHASSYPDLDPLVPPDYLTPEPTVYRRTGLEYAFVTASAHHSRIALSGLGGDPALRFVPTYWLEWLQTGRWRDLVPTFTQYVKLLGRRPPLYLKAVARYRRRRDIPPPPVPACLDTGLVERLALNERRAEMYARTQQATGALAMTDSPFWQDLFGWADAGFTRLPIVFQHPFFDIRLLEFVRAIPPIPWLVQKTILREAMSGALVEEVRLRKKTLLAANPFVALARARGIQPNLEELVSRAPGLDQFVDRQQLKSLLPSIPESGTDAVTRHAIQASLGLAHWLLHWKRPSSASVTSVGSGSAPPVRMLAVH
jgi:asparagine synthase (glutamine-hydrolysing)